MTTVAQFYASISSNIGKGTSQDAKIPDAARKAARSLEEEFAWDHMKQEFAIDFEVTAPPYDLSFLANVRQIDYIRFAFVNSDGTESFTVLNLQSGTVADLSERLDTDPDFLIYYGNPRRLEFGWHGYTNWPVGSGVGTELPILDSIENALEAETMLFISRAMRDDRLYNFWEPQRSKTVTTAKVAQNEGFEAQQSYVMEYRG